jgi:hypothetical protein
MTRQHNESNPGQADALLAFGDDLMDGAGTPTNDLETTMFRVQRAAGATATTTENIPATIKTSIWENLMHTHAVPTDNVLSANRFPVGKPGKQNAVARDWTSLQRAMSRFQAGISLAIVIAVLGGLVAIAYQIGPSNGPGNGGTSAVGQVLYNPDDASSYPSYPETCVSNGDVPSDDELKLKSLADWPAPQYTPVKAVTEATGRAVQETYLNYLRCEQELFASVTPAAAATATSPVQSPLLQSYFSDRARFDHLSSELPAAQQAAIASYRCQPRSQKVERDFPLPVNQPEKFTVSEDYPDGSSKYVQEIFAASDVYLLPDGRYGAIIGSISLAEVLKPAVIPQTGYPWFYAFVESNGRYYLDELFPLFTTSAYEAANGPSGSLSTDCG